MRHFKDLCLCGAGENCKHKRNRACECCSTARGSEILAEGVAWLGVHGSPRPIVLELEQRLGQKPRPQSGPGPDSRTAGWGCGTLASARRNIRCQ